MGLLKKSKAKEAEPIKVNVTADETPAPSVVYEVPKPREPLVPDYLISANNIDALCKEIQDKLPALRNLAHCQPIVFFCEESLRALAGLQDNMGLYCGKLLLEAQRAANSQGGGK